MKGQTKSKKYAGGGKVSAFGQAFRDARKAGDKEFTFGGKKFTTDTREEDYAKKLKTSTAAMRAVGNAPETVSGPPKAATPAPKPTPKAAAPAPKAAAPAPKPAPKVEAPARKVLHAGDPGFGAAYQKKLDAGKATLARADAEKAARATGMRKGGKVKKRYI